MDRVRESIRGYITSGIIKTEGIKKLKREFKIDEKKLMKLWLDERDILQPSKRPTNKRNNDVYMNIRIKKKDLKVVMEFLKTL